MSAQTQTSDRPSSERARPAVAARGVGATRAAAALLAVLLLATLVVTVTAHGEWGAAVLGILGPDLALLLGGGAGLARGQLHPRAVPAYNALHRPAPAAVLVVLAAFGVLAAGWLVLAVAWLFHISVDRAVGYGLRDAQGFQRD